MPRYIADSYLYRAVGADTDGACGRCRQGRSDCMRHSLSRMDICGIIEDAPTADVVEVVRCKDCCHNEGSLSEPWCRIYECRKSNNGFCNEGERKETEDGVH